MRSSLSMGVELVVVVGRHGAASGKKRELERVQAQGISVKIKKGSPGAVGVELLWCVSTGLSLVLVASVP